MSEIPDNNQPTTTMGNRAVITLDTNPLPMSPAIYLHWNGGPESVLAFCEAALRLGVSSGDRSYGLARLTQIIANYFGGVYSVGVGTIGTLDTDNGDNGLYRVEFLVGVRIWQYRRGLLDTPVLLDNEQIKKHPYWREDDGEPTMLTVVLNRNKEIFNREG